MAQKREMVATKESGFSISDLILVAVLLAAGAVLKAMLPVNFLGMKPNFVIAMYCLAILLIQVDTLKTRLLQALIIGVLAGAICQFLPGTPWLNLISEPVGGVVMGLMLGVNMKIKKVDLSAAGATLVATIASGSTFIASLFVFNGVPAENLKAYIPVVLLTAVINAVIVQILYLPLKKILKK
ncbi:MAG TPA: tryptophan transporter [Candidatus Limiplasma sp.]|nr:tryptophan transporter [Candidatus Limiplasma sp.]